MFWNNKNNNDAEVVPKTRIEVTNENKQLSLQIMQLQDQVSKFNEKNNKLNGDYSKLIKDVKTFCQVILDRKYAESQLGGFSDIVNADIFTLLDITQKYYKERLLEERRLILSLTETLKNKDFEIQNLKAQISQMMVQQRANMSITDLPTEQGGQPQNQFVSNQQGYNQGQGYNQSQGYNNYGQNPVGNVQKQNPMMSTVTPTKRPGEIPMGGVPMGGMPNIPQQPPQVQTVVGFNEDDDIEMPMATVPNKEVKKNNSLENTSQKSTNPNNVDNKNKNVPNNKKVEDKTNGKPKEEHKPFIKKDTNIQSNNQVDNAVVNKPVEVKPVEVKPVNTEVVSPKREDIVKDVTPIVSNITAPTSKPTVNPTSTSSMPIHTPTNVGSSTVGKSINETEKEDILYALNGNSSIKAHMIDLNMYLNKMDVVMWNVMVCIGVDGLSVAKEIKRLIQERRDVTESMVNTALLDLRVMGIINEEKINVGSKWFYVYNLSETGSRIFYEKFNKDPVLCEKQKLIKDHATATHGYCIKEVAELLQKKLKYTEATYDRKSNVIHLGDDKSYIPDIICKAEGQTQYIEVELGHHMQNDFNEKCDKMLMVSKNLFFVVPSTEISNKILKQLAGWITYRGGKDKLEGMGIVIYVTTTSKLAKGKWEVIYPI